MPEKAELLMRVGRRIEPKAGEFGTLEVCVLHDDGCPGLGEQANCGCVPGVEIIRGSGRPQ
jgi:hypothetical protein